MRAFTLLEILVVLTLVAVLAGIALPNAGRFIDSFAAATQWRSVEANLDGLPFRAFSSGTTLSLENATARTLLTSLPGDWKITLPQPIRYRADGWCDGGTLTIAAADGRAREYRLTAPQCRAETP